MIMSSYSIILLLIIITILIGISLYFIKNKNAKYNSLHILETSFSKGYTHTSTNISNDNSIVSSSIDSSNGINNTNTHANNTSLINTIGHTLSDPNLWIAVSIDASLRFILVKAVNKVTQKMIIKTAFKIEEQILKISSRILEKLGQKYGAELLSRLGMKAGEKAAIKAAEVAAIKAAEVAAAKAAIKAGETAASTVAAQQLAAAATGPAAPFVEAALLAFDVFSISIDLADAGGYNKLGTIEEYKKMKIEIDNEIKKAFAEQNSTYPSTVGPLDKLTSDETKYELTEEIKRLMDPITQDPLVLPMLEAIKNDIAFKVLSESDLDDDTKMQKYTDMINIDALSQKALDNICINKDGLVIDGKCSFKNKETCDSSYTWPLKEDSNEQYVEYNNTLGVCQTASYAMRGICELNNIPYDSNTGICKIDENYCKSKGADWKFNDKTQENDCIINTGQNVSELIFGTTITRGIKQLFDPSQYETCNSNEIDDGYFCRRINCPDNQNNIDGLCYPKCPSGYHAFGGNICTPDCPEGMIDDGATCRNPIDTYGRGTGYALWDQPKCYSENPQGCEQNGLLYYPKCRAGYTADGCCICRKGGEVISKGSAIGNGIGTPAATIRPKKRIVPYSSRQN